MDHVRYDCDAHGHCSMGSGEDCWLCDGGLFMCGICGQAEAELTDECPGPCVTCDRPYDQHEFDPADRGCSKYTPAVSSST